MLLNEAPLAHRQLSRGHFARLAPATDRETHEEGEKRAQQQAEEAAAHASQAFYRALSEHASDIVAILDAQGAIRYVSPSCRRILGYSPADLVARISFSLLHPEDAPVAREQLARLLRGDDLDALTLRMQHVNGDWRWLEVVGCGYLDDPGVQGILINARDVTERVSANAALRESEERFRALLESAPDAIVSTDHLGRIVLANSQTEQLFGYRREELIGQPVELLLPDRMRELHTGHRASYNANPRTRPMGTGRQLYGRTKDGREVPVEISLSPLTTQGERLVTAVIRDITDRKAAEEALRRSEERYRTLYETMAQGVVYQDAGGRVIAANPAAERILGLAGDQVGGPQGTDVCRHAIREDGSPFPRDAQPAMVALRTGRPASNLMGVLHPGEETYRWISVHAIPQFQGGEQRPAQVFTTFEDITARKQAEQRSERHLERLSAQRTIDRAITSSLDLRLTLGILLDQVLAQLGVDAAGVLLLNAHVHTLEHAVARGFRGGAPARTPLRLGQGHAGRAALERRLVSAPDLRLEPLARPGLIAQEGFVAYFALPLLAKGEVKGVLELFHRAPFHPEPDWLEFLEVLAGQAAIAVDNATLFDRLQRSNMELSLAYDTTIEGWSRALDLRDRETEGHSRRVTELTLRLARAFGMGEGELVHVRRGALLHDIGKMGIPDSILLKPGPLTEEEWEVMRRHPVYAYELLAPIAHLRPALDIPYCHHERWDGTGYPQGLQGELIPLAARIFAVADVWDALRSDRPYRSGWPEDKVREHIRTQARSHLDPQVVEAFLSLEEP